MIAAAELPPARAWAPGHLASLAREYRIPALLDTEIATAALAAGTEVTVDAFHGNVYEGRVEELLQHAVRRPEVLEGTPLLQALGRALEHVTPLNLVNPAGEDFHPEACRSFHDIARFSHEKAMDEMFDLARAARGGRQGAARHDGAHGDHPRGRAARYR